MRLPSFVETFAQLLDSRFNFTVGVSGRVARLAESLGKSVGLDEPRLKQLRLAALLHDVGQLAVSGSGMMAKPGILSVEELRGRAASCHSHDIVQGITRPRGRRRVGVRPPWSARTALYTRGESRATKSRSRRGYWPSVTPTPCSPPTGLHRQAMEAQEAMRQLRAAGGTQLDRDLVDVFLSRVAS